MEIARAYHSVFTVPYCGLEYFDGFDPGKGDAFRAEQESVDIQGVFCYADKVVRIEIFFLSSHIKCFQATASVILYLVKIYKYSRERIQGFRPLRFMILNFSASISVNLRLITFF